MTSAVRNAAGQPTRIVFLGTPDFVVPVLRALHDAPDCTVALVVTQPDRPAGRGRRLVASPVKEFALAQGLPVLQPERLRGDAVIEALRAAEAELFVIAAYGQILRQSILDIPPQGCLNVHPSLLPRHRGPSPIASAILAGDAETGVTIMLTDRGMDTGPILTQERMPLPENVTTADLTPRLFERGAALLLRTITDWMAGLIVPRPQDDAGATVTRTFVKSDGLINWTASAQAIERQVRALNPWPRAYTFEQGKRLIALDAREATAADYQRVSAMPAGAIIATVPDGPVVATGAGAVVLSEVQPEGRRAIAGGEYARSRGDLVGRRLGEDTGTGDGA